MKFTGNNKTTVAGTSTIYETTDYDQFKVLTGNRPVDETHVKRLMRKIENEGNLTPEHPIEVNEDKEVVDGQHRLEALKRLGMPAYFVIRPGLNVDNVASLNTGNKNWTWQDFARHWSERGNENYTKFLAAAEQYEPRYSVLLVYLTGSRNLRGRGKRTVFDSGELGLTQYELGIKLLQQYGELANLSNHNATDFAIAAYRFMRMPNYKQDKMVAQMMVNGGRIFNNYSVADYLEALEEIYNA